MKFALSTILLFVVAAVYVIPTAAQKNPSGKAGSAEALELVRIGDGNLATGQRTAFRVYSTPNGTKGQVVYTTFPSLQAAEHQISDWLKPVEKVISRKRGGKKAKVLNDHIVAVAAVPRSDNKQHEYVVIRRDNLRCYLIESPSLQVAQRIESLIENE